MERAKLCIVVPPERRNDIMAMLRSLVGPVSVSRGCLKCRLFQNVLDENMVCWEEEWRTRDDLHRHIRSRLYHQILVALDLASEKPEVCFEHVSDRLGMELIASVRSDRKSGSSDP